MPPPRPVPNPTRRRIGPLVAVTAVVSVAATAVLLAGATLFGRAVTANLEVGLSRTTHECRTDPSLSGVQGYCLDRVSRPDLGLVSGRAEVRVHLVVDGGYAGRYLSVEDPFAGDDEVTVTWPEGGGVQVSDGTATLSYDRAALEGLGQ